jgi:hypothetical protein
MPIEYTSPASRERSRSVSDAGEGAAGGTLTRRASRADLSREAGEVYTHAELRALLADCLMLWGVQGRVVADDVGVTINTGDGAFSLQHAPPNLRPARWLLQTPPRQAANRPPRAAPSIVALLTALRNALGAASGTPLRIGIGAPAS